jgi:hypothetical protein
MTYYPYQRENTAWRKNVAEIIKENTEEDDVLLIYGLDAWNPVIAYYAQRKALMDPAELRIDSAQMQRSLSALAEHNEKLSVMVIFGPRSSEFIEERVQNLEITQIFHVIINNGKPVVKRTLVERNIHL